MVDIHSHILFGVDDGAKDIEESIELLKQAVSVGYTDIVCSSHYYIGLYENKDYLTNFNLLQNEIKRLEIPINIYLGNEFNLDSEYFSHKNRINKINNSRYFLVEIKSNIIYSICKDFFQMLLEKGVTPIFAHVERYNQIRVEELIELSQMGVVLQMNLGSAVGELPKAKYLLENRYIDVIATDTHKYGKRDYNIKEKLDKLKSIIGDEYFQLLTEINPKKVINNENILKLKGEKNEFKKSDGISSIFNSLWSKFWSRKFWTK
ncbi:MAG: tyrosine-protein phosphatase [Fusobacterium sp.]|uniref:tyrosine-protein phosphatase n=1 Tax=Fusobacterium sp. TaxID=68766 RepID=UPI0039997189